MKKLLTTLIFLLCFHCVFPAPVDVNRALSLAKAFDRKESILKVPGKINPAELSLIYTCTDKLRDREAIYYVFGRSGQEGFILVSGDDRTAPVLGYSDTGNFAWDALPDNFKGWLKGIQQEMQYLKETAPEVLPFIYALPANNNSYATSVAPLLDEIAWSQDAPYYNLCPMEGMRRTYTGCVATAMAQIMRYHQWPQQGKGSHSYTSRTNKFELSVDFSQSYYDWDNMTARYTEQSTAEEKAAVAKLMFDCGVAVEMDYTSAGSGTYSELVVGALSDYFDYDKNMQIYSRDYYSYAEWLNLLKEELNHQRPVYISGSSLENGHAFVCDGYDSDDLFHINWGWGGMSNGYFVISILDPSTQGIGGGKGGYKFSQNFITGIQPPSATSKLSYNIYLETDLETDESVIGRNDAVVLQTSLITNQGANKFDGQVGIALYQNNTQVALFNVEDVFIQTSRWNTRSWPAFSIPASIANGVYKLYPVYKGNGETEWSIIRSRGLVSNYLAVTVSNTEIHLAVPADAKAQLRVPEGGFTYSELIAGETATFHVTVENSGKEAYTQLSVIFTKGEYNWYFVASDAMTVPANGSVSLELEGYLDLPAGNYTVLLACTTSLYLVGLEGESEYEVVVNRKTATTPELSFAKTPSTSPSEAPQDSRMTVFATVHNAGISTSGNLYVIIYKSTGGSYLKTYSQALDVPENKSVDFQMEIPVELEKGSYYLQFQFQSTTGERYIKKFNDKVYFSVIDPVAIQEWSGTAGTSVYPNPAREFIRVEAPQTIQSIKIMNTSGQLIRMEYPAENSRAAFIPVERLAAGIYFVQIQTVSGTEIRKFIKQ